MMPLMTVIGVDGAASKLRFLEATDAESVRQHQTLSCRRCLVYDAKLPSTPRRNKSYAKFLGELVDESELKKKLADRST